MSSRLQVRKIFLLPGLHACNLQRGNHPWRSAAASPTRHLLARLGSARRASSVGSALLNSLGAFRTGLRYHPIVGFRDPAFREWFKLSLPLMIGVSLVMFDGIFLKFFASAQVGGITLITNSKSLFNAPFNVIGPAAEPPRALLRLALPAEPRPRFLRLGRPFRLAPLRRRMIVSAWMIALAPWLMDLFRGASSTAPTPPPSRNSSASSPSPSPSGRCRESMPAPFMRQRHQNPMITGNSDHSLSSVRCTGASSTLTASSASPSQSDPRNPRQTASVALLLHRKHLVSFTHLEFENLAAPCRRVVAYAATAAATAPSAARPTHTKDVLHHLPCIARLDPAEPHPLATAPGSRAILRRRNIAGVLGAPSSQRLAMGGRNKPHTRNFRAPRTLNLPYPLASTYSSRPSRVDRLQYSLVRLCRVHPQSPATAPPTCADR